MGRDELIGLGGFGGVIFGVPVLGLSLIGMMRFDTRFVLSLFSPIGGPLI